MKMDVIYRCCETEVHPPYKKSRPNWFNKLNCLKTFIKTLETNKEFLNSVVFLHDGKKGDLFDAIPKKYDIININDFSNEKSLIKTFDIADTLNGDMIYFVEDDYLHLEYSIMYIYYGVKNLNLVNGYDHLDRYIRDDDISKGCESITFLKETNCHWRTSESTCCTWATTRNMWNLIKHSARHFKLQDRNFFRNLIKNNIRLWTPMPGVTTQVDDKLSPGINWKTL